jgi:hypothetical protein
MVCFCASSDKTPLYRPLILTHRRTVPLQFYFAFYRAFHCSCQFPSHCSFLGRFSLFSVLFVLKKVAHDYHYTAFNP